MSQGMNMVTTFIIVFIIVMILGKIMITIFIILSAQIKLKNENLEVVNKTKLLGAVITSDLKWHENTKFIIKKANKKMIMLHKFSKFTNNKSHLIHIFKSQVRGVLE